MEKKIIIGVFCYSRAGKLKQCIDALLKNPECPQLDIIFFSDGYKGEKDKNGVLETRAYIDSITGFKSVIKHFRETNLSTGPNFETGLKYLSANYDEFIIVEDDLVVSSNYIKFLRDGLDFYRQDYSVFCVTAYNYPVRTGDYPYDTIVYKRFCSYGWAGWGNRFKNVVWDKAALQKIMDTSPGFKKRLNAEGYDLVRMLKKQISGAISTWDIQMQVHVAENRLKVIFPVLSKVTNIGFDEESTNTFGVNWLVTPVDNGSKRFFNFCNPDLVVPALQKQIKRPFSLPQLIKRKLINEFIKKSAYRKKGDMRILIIHTVYQFSGGEDSVVANEMELLRSTGHTVELLKFSNSGGALVKLAQSPFNLSSYRKTKRKIAEFRPDVAHIHNLHFAGSPSVIYALKKYKIPTVITLHNYRLLCPSATMFFKGKLFTGSINKDFNWDAVIKGVYQNSVFITFWVSLSMWLHQKLGTWNYPAKYIALGENTVDIFKDSKLDGIADRIIVKPNFCYPANVKVIKNHSYLYVGRLSEEKGITTLLAAFSANRLPLTIAGTGPLEQEVIRFARQYSNITYLGLVDKDKVNDLIASARALIFPSQWYETFGMVIIEAFASGTPVIASDLGQLKYTITNHVNGLLFKPGDVIDLREKISVIHEMTEQDHEILRQNAKATYERKYQPGENARMLVEIYKQTVGKVIES